MNNRNNISARMSFEQSLRSFYNAFRDKFPPGPSGDKQCKEYVEALKFSQSEIRLEVKLDAAKNVFAFGLTENNQNTNGAKFNTEQRLRLQDSLCANEYGIFVGNPASDIDTLWNIRTYGNEVDWTAPQAQALNTTFYSHGKFIVKCNNDIIMPYRGLLNHLYRGQTQQTAALGANSPDDQICGAEDGFITDEPNVVLIGSKGYDLNIELPVNLAAVGTFTRAIVIFKGVLAQNSTSVS